MIRILGVSLMILLVTGKVEGQTRGLTLQRSYATTKKPRR